ncbi:MAG: PAS domain-containing protein, partial [Methylotenera sp.]|nr:PAS domain-containing protein [Methylotenera sp.]
MITDFFTKKNKEIAKLTAINDLNAQEILNKDKLISELRSHEDTLLRIKSAIDGSSAAIMTIDRNFIVNYVNTASMKLFNGNREEFKKVFPSFDPDKIVGTCIDVFHKNPQHQRQLLATPVHLPFSTEIKVGPLTIALYVTAIYGTKGDYVGNILEWRDITEAKKREIQDFDSRSQKQAIDIFQGAIELDLDGNILFANETYLSMLGYSANELIGRHVSLVLDPNFAKSAEYSALWARLIKGEYVSGQYKRIAKGGREVWIQAYYSPIYDMAGKQVKVVNYVIDITEQKLQAADNAGRIDAVNKIQGVIEFDLKGNILAMNENFAKVTGYSEKEVVGKHHSLFVEPAYKASQEYKEFWHNLVQGQANAGQFKRINKSGDAVWLQAFYAPILDINGNPYKVIKFATDITEQQNNAQALADAVEETQAIIEDAKAGDLSSRVSLAGKTGAIASLCDGVNALMDKMTEVIIQ